MKVNNEIAFHTHQDGHNQKTDSSKYWLGGTENQILICCWGEGKMAQLLWKTVWQFLKWLNRVTMIQQNFIPRCI